VNLCRFFAVLTVLAGTTVAAAAEKKVTMKDLPTPVQKSVQAQMPGATLKGLTRETDNGKVFYEAELVVNGHTKDVIMSPDGSVATIEEEVPLTSLPAPVKAAFEQRAARGRILGVEAITEHDAIVAYEARIKTGAKTSEVKASLEGKLLK
jgi:hypothetical protein